MSGKRERPSDFQIDEKTLQYKNKPQQQEDKNEQDDVSERKIYKIKRPQDNDASSQEKVNFSLISDLTQKKPQLQPSKDKNQEKKEKSSIFTMKSSQNGIGIFTTSSNLFSNNKGISPPKFQSKNFTSGQGQSSSSIFNFANNGAPPVSKNSGSLFSQMPQQGDDGSGDSEQLEKDQENEADPTKSHGKYQYKQECDILFSEKALKYKKDGGELVENVEVIIARGKDKKLSWVTVQLVATKNNIFTGVLVKGKSQIKNFGGKVQNISIVAAQVKKEMVKHILKIQFENESQGKKIISVFEEL